MIKAVIAVPAEDENLLEEVLWIHGALSVETRPPHETARVVIALFEAPETEAVEAALRTAVPALGTLGWEPVVTDAWQMSWRNNFKPLDIGSFKLVGSWETDFPEDARIIRIYPGMAFGTGQHETTQLIIESLERMDLQGQRVLDAGCGTGILAIVAERLGAASVFGFDIDPDCRENMALHLELNRTTRTRLEIGTVHDVAPGSYDLILANITVNVLKDVWPVLAQQLAPGGLLVSSGILDEQRVEAEAALAELGFQITEARQKGEWVMLAARRA